MKPLSFFKFLTLPNTTCWNTPSIALRAVAALTLVAAVTLWCASLTTVFLSVHPLQLEKAGLEVVAIGSWVIALVEVTFRSKFPRTMHWPLSSGRLAFLFSVAYSVVSLAWQLHVLRNDDGQYVSFWVQAPTV